jgi:methionyl-tRNA formyltransferase
MGTSGNSLEPGIGCRPTLRVGEILNKTAASQKRPTTSAIGNGVTGGAHYVDEGIDTGDIIVQESIPIEPADNNESLCVQLSVTGASLLADVARRLAAGETLPRRPQDHAQATYFTFPGASL